MRKNSNNPTAATSQKQGDIVAIGQSLSYEGPLPHPDLFKRYEETLPGAADRILKMAESEQNQRHQTNKELLAMYRDERKRGQYLGCFLSAGFALMGFILGYLGHEWLAGTIFIVSVISIAVVFVLNKEPENKDKNI